ncbi:MAG: YeeE/YedE family protein [Desulfobulbaceae bacterium]|nr:YeeE/YedE family protein [Desulfobulbaceae bacterium]
MITGSLLLMYLVGLVFGTTAGFVMHRSDYCIAGMFRDFFLFRQTFLLRALALQLLLTLVLFEAAREAGLLPLYPFPLLAPPSLANLIGGLLFGVGMVLAGGCVVGTLYKLGSGSVLSLFAFIGLIFGSGLYAEIHPWWTTVIRQTTFLAPNRTIPQLLGLSPIILVLAVVAASLPIFYTWYRKKLWLRPLPLSGYLQPWMTAVTLALIGLGSYILIGMPLGVTTTYAKMAAMLGKLVMPGHQAATVFFQLKPLQVVHPFSNTQLEGWTGPQFDYLWAIQFPVIAGIILGSLASALLLREFRPHWHIPPYQYLLTFLGGTILGLASRMSSGCNVWHLMGGLPIFALSSLLFATGMIPGAWLGGRIISYILLKQTRATCTTYEK